VLLLQQRAQEVSVFPVPGAPMRSTPLGIRAPISKNFLGFFKKSTTSISSSFASFTPATSFIEIKNTQHKVGYFSFYGDGRNRTAVQKEI